VVEDLRGNLDTRFGRLREGHFDAAILARAGVSRLGHDDMIGEVLAAPAWLPAAGQGALGIAVGGNDRRTIDLLQPLDDPGARATTAAERAFLRALEGGCQIPIGAFAIAAEEELRLHGLVAAIDGNPLLRGEAIGKVSEPVELGRKLAAELLERGAGAILDQIRNVQISSLPHASAP
jgi:hydroxymethylbilane synthase